MRKYANVGVSRANSIGVTEPRTGYTRTLALWIQDTAQNCVTQDTRHSVQLHHAYRFDSEKLLNPTHQAGPFYIVKTVISNRSFSMGNFFVKLKYVGGPWFEHKLKIKAIISQTFFVRMSL
jgi:hypothetical protein